MKEVDLRVDVPHSARVYDYLLGGKDNYPADREVGERMAQASPGIRETARANRAFMVRAARYLAVETGIRQFLDIGTGLPTSPNLHEVVQAVDPTTRVVYVDNDPIVLVNARALLTSTGEGMTAYVDADLNDPDAIMRSAELHHALDLSRPVAVSLIGIMHFVVDDDDALHILQRLMDPLSPGSALSITSLTADVAPHEMGGVTDAAASGGITSRLRARAEVEAFFAGLDIVDPGVALVNQWRPDRGTPRRSAPVYGGVALKR